MRSVHFLPATMLAFVLQLATAQVPKKIVVEHFTNTKCSTCALRNPGFYTNLNNQTGVLHLAVHPSAPYSGCLLYQQNATANDARTNYYGIYGSTPRLVINGNVISASANYNSASIFTPYQSLTTPASVRIVQEKFGSDSIRATVIIKTEATHSLGGLSLFVALAEDTVFYTGSNGEPMHFDVFRKSLSSVSGDAVTLPANVGDSVVFTFSSGSNSIWNFSRIYTLAILQETSSKNLVQAEASSVNDGLIATGIAESRTDFKPSVFPNPAQQALLIQLPEAQPALVTLFNTEGKIVFQNRLTDNAQQIDLRDLPNATYLLNIKSGSKTYTEKIVKQ